MKNTLIALLTIVLLAVSPVTVAAECPLCDAAKNGDLSEVKRLLDNGADVRTRVSYWTPLIEAAREGHSEVAKLLLDNGAIVNYEGPSGLTALMHAALLGQSEVAKLLLDNGANVNHENEDSETALIEAARNGHSEVAKLLLDNGANVNHEDKDGKTALIKVARNGHSEVAKLLLDNGANVNHQNKEGNTALMLAALKAQSEVAKVLLDNGAKTDQLTDSLLAKGKYGKWKISTEINPIDDTTSVFMFLTADEGVNKYGDLVSMMIRCKSNTLDIAIHWGQFIGINDTHVVTRIGKDKASLNKWFVSTDKKSTFSKRRTLLWLFLRDSDSNKFIAQVTPYNHNPITAIFDTIGLDNAIKHLQEECDFYSSENLR